MYLSINLSIYLSIYIYIQASIPLQTQFHILLFCSFLFFFCFFKKGFGYKTYTKIYTIIINFVVGQNGGSIES